ncbi:MAG: hypothetical protein AAF386_13750 [Pseudomonadota bacterium]
MVDQTVLKQMHAGRGFFLRSVAAHPGPTDLRLAINAVAKMGPIVDNPTGATAIDAVIGPTQQIIVAPGCSSYTL